MYKVRYWNKGAKKEKDRFKTLEYPYLETALMMAYQLAKATQSSIYVTDETATGTYIVHCK